MRVILSRSAIALSIALVAAGVLQAADFLRQDLLFTRAETEIGFWGRDGYQPTATSIEQTERDLARLLSLAPQHPAYLSLQASYMAWRSYWAEDPEVAQHHGWQAVEAQLAALESRPARRQDWSKMVQYSSRVKGGTALRRLARERIAALERAN